MLFMLSNPSLLDGKYHDILSWDKHMQNGGYMIVGHAIQQEFNIEKYVLEAK